MANLVKVKLSVISFSVAVLFLLSGLQNGFYRTSTIKKWNEKEQLSWADFKGIPVPFSRYGATIHSKVFIEYDSISKQYTAYAGQNDMLSWTALGDEYSLKHEQYHFNITELHARKLNRYFAETGKLTHEEAEKKRDEINHELFLFQRKYDFETDHSLKTVKQNYWEYKVDSSLQEFTQGKGIFTDQLSGLSARFTKPIFFSSGVSEEKNAYRSAGMRGYQMDFFVNSLNQTEVTDDSFKEWGHSATQSDSIFLVETKFDSTGDFSFFEFNRVNKAYTHEIWDRIYKYGSDLYFSRVTAPFDTVNRTYEQIKNHFFNSISFTDTENFWIRKGASEEGKPAFTRSGVAKKEAGEKVMRVCYSDNPENIFFKTPFVDEEGSLYVAFEIVGEKEDSVLYNVAFINRLEMINWKTDSAEQLLVVPDSLLPQGSFGFEFGYLLKKDSLNPCYHFYGHSGTVNKGSD